MQAVFWVVAGTARHPLASLVGPSSTAAAVLPVPLPETLPVPSPRPLVPPVASPLAPPAAAAPLWAGSSPAPPRPGSGCPTSPGDTCCSVIPRLGCVPASQAQAPATQATVASTRATANRRPGSSTVLQSARHSSLPHHRQRYHHQATTLSRIPSPTTPPPSFPAGPRPRLSGMEPPPLHPRPASPSPPRRPPAPAHLRSSSSSYLNAGLQRGQAMR